MAKYHARNFEMMRRLMKFMAHAGRPVRSADVYNEFRGCSIGKELNRLKSDGLMTVDASFCDLECCDGGMFALTREGREFYGILADEGAWGVIAETLKSANIDVPYPLLREVCEEVVKRYVTSFMPEVKR